MKKSYFAAGCFWGAEYELLKIEGVIDTRVGFMGGEIKNPTYEKSFDHSEVVEVTYNEKFINYEELLDIFFKIHDPTGEYILKSEERKKKNFKISNEDIRYKSIIFYNNSSEKEKAYELIKKLNEMKLFDEDIITEIKKVSIFYPAKEYHQKYFLKKYKKNRIKHFIFRIIIILITFFLVLLMKIFLK